MLKLKYCLINPKAYNENYYFYITISKFVHIKFNKSKL